MRWLEARHRDRNSPCLIEAHTAADAFQGERAKQLQPQPWHNHLSSSTLQAWDMAAYQAAKVAAEDTVSARMQHRGQLQRWGATPLSTHQHPCYQIGHRGQPPCGARTAALVTSFIGAPVIAGAVGLGAERIESGYSRPTSKKLQFCRQPFPYPFLLHPI